MGQEVTRPALYPQHYTCSWSGPQLSTFIPAVSQHQALSLPGPSWEELQLCSHTCGSGGEEASAAVVGQVLIHPLGGF